MNAAPKSIKDRYEEIVPGFYALVENDVYHRTEGLGSHNVKEIGKSIAHYHYSRDYHKQTEAMVKGSAFHDLVLLPDVFKQRYVKAPTKDKRTKKYTDFVEENPTKIILTPEQWDDCYRMRDALHENSRIYKVLSNKTILRETSTWVHDTDTNLLLKARPDIIVDGVIYDIKTTISPSPRAFLHSVYEYGYHIQSPFYMYCCELAGMNVKNFVFLAVQNKPPYLTAIYDLNEELINEGRLYIREALDRYSAYLVAGGGWTGLPNGQECVTL